MKVLSMDVGLKNLAYCIFSDADTDCDAPGSMQVKAWGILNLSGTCPETTTEKCGNINKKGEKCTHPAKFHKHGQGYCLSHAKKSPYLLPTPQHKNLYKKNIPELEKFIRENELAGEIPSGKGKKAHLLSLIDHFIQEKVLLAIAPLVVASEPLPDPILAKNLTNALDGLLMGVVDWKDGETVLIEKQIGAGPMANKMTKIQGMLTQYFVMRFPLSPIHAIPARHKLSLNEIPLDSLKSTYKERKQLGIHTVRQSFLPLPIYVCWQAWFESHAKKDDLCDAFLQGIWFIRSNQV